MSMGKFYRIKMIKFKVSSPNIRILMIANVTIMIITLLLEKLNNC